ncbi:MAG TPA: hypothetical protein VFH68_08455 [Polyangia bacterium]|nr:hypothetical protein [Polyangia bacterium]
MAVGVACRGPHAAAAPADAGTKSLAAPDAGTGSAPPRQILQTLPAPPYAYELSLENCAGPLRENAKDESACLFAVRLLGGAQVLDRITLGQAGCGPATPTPVDRTLGADREATAFSTSDDRCEIDVAARTVELGANTTALLVTELQGFEYRHRSHALFLARPSKLETAWSYADDYLGMHWSTTSVIPAAQQGSRAQDIAFVDTERTTEGVAAQVRATRLHFDSASGVLGDKPLPDADASLFVLVVGNFKNADETQAARQHCVHDLEVLRARLFPKLRLPAFFLGAVFARRDDAADSLAQLASCPKAQKGTILESGISGGKSHGGHH